MKSFANLRNSSKSLHSDRDSESQDQYDTKIEQMLLGYDGSNYALSKANLQPSLIDLKLIDETEWRTYFDKEGALPNHEKLIENVYAFGVDVSIRREVWMYLLKYYPFDSTFEKRIEIDRSKKLEYERMKLQWSTISIEQEMNFSEFAIRKSIVEKDVNRTDKSLQFYQGENSTNSEKLRSILMTYCMYNFDLGYVQGMSDLLAPMLFLFHDEHLTFWCFTHFMKSCEANFHVEQIHIPALISTLRVLIQFLWPDLHQYLQSTGTDTINFVFSWLLINFKRQFSYHDVFILWEKDFTQRFTLSYSVFLAATIIGSEKDFIIKNKLNSDHILSYFNRIDNHLNVNVLIEKTEKILKDLRSSKHIPPQVRELLL